jgi:hypothetical protein
MRLDGSNPLRSSGQSGVYVSLAKAVENCSIITQAERAAGPELLSA